jgi:sterol desaturase/sphingolipid hydroxylase (fatty acid hydroxylase superfamily)
MAISGAFAAALLLPRVMPTPTEAFPSAFEFIKQIVVMELVGDFGLYWGHRIQHTVPFLWENFHYFRKLEIQPHGK